MKMKNVIIAIMFILAFCTTTVYAEDPDNIRHKEIAKDIAENGPTYIAIYLACGNELSNDDYDKMIYFLINNGEHDNFNKNLKNINPIEIYTIVNRQPALCKDSEEFISLFSAFLRKKVN